MVDQAEFDLVSGVADNFRDGRQMVAPPPPNGRPKGAKNKMRRADPVWKEARNWTPAIVTQMCQRAARLEDEIDFRCAQLILSRTWAKPRSAPVQIDLSSTVDARQLLVAMAEGSLTPADAASLLNSLNRNGHNAPAAIEAGQQRDGIRESIANRLARMIEERNGRTVEQDGEAALAEILAESDGDDAADQAAVEELLAEADEDSDA